MAGSTDWHRICVVRWVLRTENPVSSASSRTSTYPVAVLLAATKTYCSGLCHSVTDASTVLCRAALNQILVVGLPT